ncbi:MAG: response regulator transcription factor [Kocuria sp.]|nr:response regulator transcription factor [Kocuria sp.]
MHTNPSSLQSYDTHSSQPPGSTTAALRHHVLIITAQTLLGHALASCITPEDNTSPTSDHHRVLALVGQVSSIQAAVDTMLTRNAPVDLAVLDLDLVTNPAYHAIKELMSVNPQLRILTLSSGDDLDQVMAALRAGACGHLSKEAQRQDFVEASLACLEEDLVVDLPVLRALAARALGRTAIAHNTAAATSYGLQHHELEALEHLARGLSNQEIADALFVSVGSVKAYLTGASKKLGVRDRLQLLIRAIELDLVVPRLG